MPDRMILAVDKEINRQGNQHLIIRQLHVRQHKAGAKRWRCPYRNGG